MSRDVGLFLNKMLSREAAYERYGAIDLTSKTWPENGKWMTMFEIPKGYFPNLTIMDTGIPAKHIACNKDILRPLTDALNQLIFYKLDPLLVTYDGCLSVRAVRGEPGRLSAHAYGVAVDFNAATNGLGSHGDMRDDVAECFIKQGFDWGKKFKRIDPMHFSYCWEGGT